MDDAVFMAEAIAEARRGIERGDGGPFGSVVVHGGEIVGCGHNTVVRSNDPTAHGEISAIRNACAALATFDLSGCTLYTTGEPCPMCLAACMWANVERVVYGCTLEDNAAIGFRDVRFDKTLSIDREALSGYLTRFGRDDCLKVFDEYRLIGGTRY